METREPINNPLVLRLSHINWRAWLPSRGNVLFTLVIVFSLFWAQAAHALPGMQPATVATSTGTWPYQGRLATSSGTPITATVPMIFRLYNASGSGATPLWEEQWTGPNSVVVSDGLFNVMLGSLTVIPQSIVNGNSSLWLGITAGTDNEMTPRVQLGSVPFAAQALTVPDGSIGTAKLAALNVTTAKIADANITTAKIADGAITQAKLSSGISMIPPDGSITTAKLVSGAVTSDKFRPTLFQNRFDTGISIDTNYKDLLTLNINFPVDATYLIVLNFYSMYDGTGNGRVMAGLRDETGRSIDGAHNAHASGGGRGTDSASIVVPINFSAGPHTIIFNAATDGQTATVRGAEIFAIPFAQATTP